MAATSNAAALASAVTGLFDAIRSKTGASGSMTWAQATGAVSTMKLGMTADDVAGRRFPSALSGSATTIGSYAFAFAYSPSYDR